MLVLTRKVGEGIVIGDDIRIYFLEEKEGRMRIGIEAPREKKIYRQEVYDRISRENKEAAQWNIADLNALSKTLSQRNRDE